MNGSLVVVRAFHRAFTRKDSENCRLESLIFSVLGSLENSRLIGDYSYVARSMEIESTYATN